MKHFENQFFMAKKFILLFLLAICQSGICLAQLPCIRSNTETITYSINGKPSGNTWTIVPELKPDIMSFGTKKKWNRVVFYTDVDSFVCKAQLGKNYRFYILLNGKDSALTQISPQPMPPPHARFSKKYIAYYKGKSQFEVPEVQELVHIIMALTPTGLADKNMVEHNSSYYEEVMKHYGPWKDHPAVAAVEAELQNGNYGHLKMDACGYLFNGNRLRKDGIYDRLNWGDHNLIEPMVSLLEDFALKSGFKAFYKGHGGYYSDLIDEAEKYMPIRPQWTWCEREFPNRYDHYRITFSPLVGGWHCTNRFEDKNFKQTVMFICDANGKKPEVSDKVWEGIMTRVVFTEIDHNYVNPVSDGYEDQIRDIFTPLSFWADEKMTAGYDSPYAVFNEYMTWAVFTLYALDTYDQETFETVNARTEKQMVEWRGFLHFKEFNRQLLELYRNRPTGKKVADLYPDILAWAAAFHKK
jgi:hypothetical protein